MKIFKALLCIALCVLCLTLCCCNEKDLSLTAEYTRSEAVPVYDFYAEDSATPENYSEYSDAYLDFAANLLTNCDTSGNIAVSPMSLYTALLMTANGANGKTRSQIETALGENLETDELNTFTHYLNTRVTAFNNESGKVTSANALWINNEYSVKAQFLQTIVNYFDSQIFRTELSSQKGVEEINDWINKSTNGEIDSLVDNLSVNTKIVLTNALVFDDNWVTPYEDAYVYEGVFNGAAGTQEATYMHSNEMLLTSNDAKGFVKSFENTPCKLLAILPNDNISLEQYLTSLSGAKLSTLMSSQSGVNRCEAHIPQFDIESSLTLNDTLKAMGMELMFSADSDFSALTMSDGLFVSDVLQKCNVEIGTQGAKASAASSVVMKDSASTSEFESLIFDRPFIYMIIENESNLPLFMGVVQNTD